jgi:hypothetical protein
VRALRACGINRSSGHRSIAFGNCGVMVLSIGERLPLARGNQWGW